MVAVSHTRNIAAHNIFGVHKAPRHIGVLREIKKDHLGRFVENRVILTPAQVRKLIKKTGIAVFVEANAGRGIGASDADYIKAGAKIRSRKEILGMDLVLGVKETQKGDHKYLGAGVHMSYEHFADSGQRLIEAIRTSVKKATTFLALETMQNIKGLFPTLMPMSEAAAEEVAQLVPSIFMKKFGLLPSGLPRCHIAPLVAVVLGGGIVGKTAAVRLSKLGLNVTLIESNKDRRRELEIEFRSQGINIIVKDSNHKNMVEAFTGANVLVSGVYRRGTTPPKIVTKSLLNKMSKQAVAFFIDVDQGSSFKGKLPKSSVLEPFNLKRIAGTHVLNFSPPNLPSMAARHTSQAIGNAVLPFVYKIAKYGLIGAARRDQTILTGINIFSGNICCEGLAKTFRLPYKSFISLVGAMLPV